MSGKQLIEPSGNALIVSDGSESLSVDTVKSARRKMPEQKPGRSKQDYGTPPELLRAVKNRLCIEHFDIDLAASPENAVCANYYTALHDSLSNACSWKVGDGWAWLNPPFADIRPWVQKACDESYEGANIVMLLPASFSNWWRDYVEGCCYQVFLTGRLTFVGETTPYPKDCALLFYTPWGFRGNEVWDWRHCLSSMREQESDQD